MLLNPETLGLSSTTAPLMDGLIKASVALLVTFFNVPVFTTLLLLYVLDFFSGLWKASLSNKVCSNKLVDVVYRGATAAIIFTAIHLAALTVPAPWNVVASFFENFVMTIMIFREVLSVLENAKAIQHVRGIATPMLDAAIAKLGLDLEKILAEVNTKPKPAAPASSPQEAPGVSDSVQP